MAVTERCNARCLTCGLHQRQDRRGGEPPLALADYERIFRALGRGLHWVTITGGEPSLRADLAPVLVALVRLAAPQAITLATNGLLTDRVLELVQAVLAVHRHPLVVNLSLDALGAEHDRLRGVKGAFEQALCTYRRLSQLRTRYPNLLLGIHTVISRHNVEAYPEICDGLLALAPDSLIAEVAQSRVELNNLDSELAPEPQAYRRAMAHLSRRNASAAQPARNPARRTARLIQAFRARYYEAVARYLERPQELWPCLAGTASAHLSADGQLWGCGVRCDALGDLRQETPGFADIWYGEAAQRFRRQVRERRCHCTLAGAAYLSLLASPTALLQVGAALLKQELSAGDRCRP